MERPVRKHPNCMGSGNNVCMDKPTIVYRSVYYNILDYKYRRFGYVTQRGKTYNLKFRNSAQVYKKGIVKRFGRFLGLFDYRNHID